MNKDKELSSKELKKLICHLKETHSLPSDTPIEHQMQILKQLSLKDFKKLVSAISLQFNEQAFTAIFCEEHRDKLDFILTDQFVRIPFSLNSMEDAPAELVRKRFRHIMFPTSSDVEFFIKHADDIFLECIQKERISDYFASALIENNRIDLFEHLLKNVKTNHISPALCIAIAERNDFTKIAKTFFITQPFKDIALVECIKRKDIASILIALDYCCVFNNQVVTKGLFSLNNATIINKWIEKLRASGSPLYSEDEVLLMQPIYKQAILMYIDYFRLDEEAEIQLIKLQDEEITEHYISDTDNLNPASEELLFSLYGSKITSIYEKKAGLSISKEREMILKNHIPTIEAYFSEFSFYKQNEVLFFKTCPEEVCLKYINIRELHDITDAYLMKYGSKKLVTMRINKCIETNSKLCDVVEVIFFSKHSKELTLPYLKVFSPSLISEILPYLDEEHYEFLEEVSQPDVQKFVESPNASCDAILLFAKKQGLSRKSIQVLIKEKRLDVLSKIFEQKPLSSCNQSFMMKEEYLDIVAEYIKYHDLDDDVEVAFVKIAPKDMIDFYQERYVISLKAEREMIILGLF